MLLHKAIRKYGREAFTIESVATVGTLAEASELEQKMIQFFNSIMPGGYNIACGGMGTPGVRRPHSDETRKKIGAGNRGRIISVETRKKQSIAKKGIRPSAETRAKLSKARRGRIIPQAQRAKQAATVRGRKFPRRSIALLQSALVGGARTSTGYRGIIAEGRNWTARLGLDGQRVHLGTFETIEEAVAAYRQAVSARIKELECRLANERTEPLKTIIKQRRDAKRAAEYNSPHQREKRRQAAYLMWQKRRFHSKPNISISDYKPNSTSHR
jgi:hypothetical protein